MLNYLRKLKRFVYANRQDMLWSNALNIERFRHEHLTINPKYTAKHLQRYEFQTCSQNGEDGMITELFRRIGVTNSYFIEFGVERGIENNTVNLLRKGWSGLWIEGSPEFCARIKETHADVLTSKRLTVLNSIVDASNVEALFSTGGVPAAPDLLSIDIDGNDWYVWRAISKYQPRVVVVEYNSHFQAEEDVVVSYNPTVGWDGSMYFGASLAAFDRLARERGYNLVGCDFTGTNAFFVKSDLLGEHFQAPFTPAFHWEPCRFFLHRRVGHPSRYGAYTSAAEQLTR